MMLTGFQLNEYGVVAAAGTCDTCSKPYTVIPVPEPEHWACWANCLGPGCPSYDIDRDVDMFFEPLADHGLIQREETG